MLKSMVVELGCDDKKAKEHFLDSLSICSHDHILSRKLLHHFAAASGPMLAVIGDWFDLAQMEAYDYTIPAPQGQYANGDRPSELLVSFVQKYLQATPNGVVICENWGANRKTYENWQWGPAPPVSCFGDNEVYHILTPQTTDPETIEDTIRAAHQWQTNVCSQCAHVPEGDIPNEAFLDEIVQNAKYIFIPAFDGSGYLIWSPAIEMENGGITEY